MKLAVIFPGIGYHTDKPLLYYSKKLAMEYGYEVKEVFYKDVPKDIKGSKEKMREAFQAAMEQTRKLLKETDFKRYEAVLFISKSIGTAVASAYALENKLLTYHVFYTPVEGTFDYMGNEGIAFTGTKDPWVELETVKTGCEQHGISLYITENGNHSLETGDVLTDVSNLSLIMTQTKKYIEGIHS